MSRILTAVLFNLLIIRSIESQNFITGYVYDNSSKEPLIGAIIYDSISNIGVVTNEFGLFRIKTKQNAQLKISYTGYGTVYFSELNSPMDIEIFLSPNSRLSEVTIQADHTPIEYKLPGVFSLPVERIKSIPSIGGERDIIKAIAIMPGVSNGGEGTSSLLVRGGGQDQNLFVLDGAPVYNTGHLLNFISVFNPDALKKVDFYKGGMPARFGGRLSSVMDVTFKEGNKVKPSGLIDLGLINSKISFEGPLGKQKKTSYLVAARTTYLNFLFALAGRTPKKVKAFQLADYTGYNFYDLNFKINHEWNQRQKIYFSYFEGSDRLRVMESNFRSLELIDRNISIKNKSATLKYFHLLSNKFSFNTILNYTSNNGANLYSEDKETVIGSSSPIFSKQINNRTSSLKDYSLFFQFDYSLNNSNFLRFGLQNTIHQYRPNESSLLINEYQTKDSSIFDFKQIYSSPHLQSLELGAYVENEFVLNNNLGGNIGLRATYFRREKTNFRGLEPRGSLRYTIAKWLGINITYAKNYQYNQALLSNESGLERLIWVPSGNDLKPQSSETFSAGITKSIKSWGMDFSIESYLKRMKNLSQFIYYYDFGDNIYQNWQNNLLKEGIGKSYGLEFLANRSEGKLNGLVSYTLSKTTRQFPNFNGGRDFAFKYDRRHNINLFLSYHLTSKWKIGTLFNYATGFKFTLPEGKIKDVPFFSNLNNPENYLYLNINKGIVPDYHRLDLSASHENKRKNGRVRTWSFNIYNTYNRINPLYIYIQKGYTFPNPPNPPTVYPTRIKAVNLLPIFPSINYSLKF